MDNTWIVEVLADLRTFCSSNGEQRLAECLGQVEKVARDELKRDTCSASMPLLTQAHINCVK